jgi:hypothetical protein
MGWKPMLRFVRPISSARDRSSANPQPNPPPEYREREKRKISSRAGKLRGDQVYLAFEGTDAMVLRPLAFLAP